MPKSVAVSTIRPEVYVSIADDSFRTALVLSAPAINVSSLKPNRYRRSSNPSVNASVSPSLSISSCSRLVLKYAEISSALVRKALLEIALSLSVVPENPKRYLKTSNPSVRASVSPSPSISNEKSASDDRTF